MRSLTRYILIMVSKFCEDNNLSFSEFARKADISKAWLSKLRHTDADLTLETASKILNVMDYELQVNKKEKKTTKISRLKKVVKCQSI